MENFNRAFNDIGLRILQWIVISHVCFLPGKGAPCTDSYDSRLPGVYGECHCIDVVLADDPYPHVTEPDVWCFDYNVILRTTTMIKEIFLGIGTKPDRQCGREENIDHLHDQMYDIKIRNGSCMVSYYDELVAVNDEHNIKGYKFLIENQCQNNGKIRPMDLDDLKFTICLYNVWQTYPGVTVFDPDKYSCLAQGLPDFCQTFDPTSDPTIDPTRDPTFDPSVDPTFDPTRDPTSDPTADPTSDPTYDPTADPTSDPTKEPTKEPTEDRSLNCPRGDGVVGPIWGCGEFRIFVDEAISVDGHCYLNIENDESVRNNGANERNVFWDCSGGTKGAVWKLTGTKTEPLIQTSSGYYLKFDQEYNLKATSNADDPKILPFKYHINHIANSRDSGKTFAYNVYGEQNLCFISKSITNHFFVPDDVYKNENNEHVLGYDAFGDCKLYLQHEYRTSLYNVDTINVGFAVRYLYEGIREPKGGELFVFQDGSGTVRLAPDTNFLSMRQTKSCNIEFDDYLKIQSDSSYVEVTKEWFDGSEVKINSVLLNGPNTYNKLPAKCNSVPVLKVVSTANTPSGTVKIFVTEATMFEYIVELDVDAKGMPLLDDGFEAATKIPSVADQFEKNDYQEGELTVNKLKCGPDDAPLTDGGKCGGKTVFEEFGLIYPEGINEGPDDKTVGVTKAPIPAPTDPVDTSSKPPNVLYIWTGDAHGEWQWSSDDCYDAYWNPCPKGLYIGKGIDWKAAGLRKSCKWECRLIESTSEPIISKWTKSESEDWHSLAENCFADGYDPCPAGTFGRGVEEEKGGLRKRCRWECYKFGTQRRRLNAFNWIKQNIVPVVKSTVKTIVSFIVGDVNERIFDASLKVDETLEFTIKGTKTFASKGKLSGSLTGKFTLKTATKFEYEIYAELKAKYKLFDKNPSFNYFRFVVGGGTLLETYVDLKVLGSISIDYTIFDKEKPKLFMLGGVIPIHITTKTSLLVGAAISIPFKLSATGGYRPMSLQFGVEYEKGKGWNQISSSELAFVPHFKLGAAIEGGEECIKFSISPYVTLTVGISFYGFLNISLPITAYLSTDLKWPASCTTGYAACDIEPLNLGYSVNLGLGVDVELAVGNDQLGFQGIALMWDIYDAPPLELFSGCTELDIPLISDLCCAAGGDPQYATLKPSPAPTAPPPVPPSQMYKWSDYVLLTDNCYHQKYNPCPKGYQGKGVEWKTQIGTKNCKWECNRLSVANVFGINIDWMYARYGMAAAIGFIICFGFLLYVVKTKYVQKKSGKYQKVNVQGSNDEDDEDVDAEEAVLL